MESCKTPSKSFPKNADRTIRSECCTQQELSDNLHWKQTDSNSIANKQDERNNGVSENGGSAHKKSNNDDIEEQPCQNPLHLNDDDNGPDRGTMYEPVIIGRNEDDVPEILLPEKRPEDRHSMMTTERRPRKEETSEMAMARIDPKVVAAKQLDRDDVCAKCDCAVGSLASKLGPLKEEEECPGTSVSTMQMEDEGSNELITAIGKDTSNVKCEEISKERGVNKGCNFGEDNELNLRDRETNNDQMLPSAHFSGTELAFQSHDETVMPQQQRSQTRPGAIHVGSRSFDGDYDDDVDFHQEESLISTIPIATQIDPETASGTTEQINPGAIAVERGIPFAEQIETTAYPELFLWRKLRYHCNHHTLRYSILAIVLIALIIVLAAVLLAPSHPTSKQPTPSPTTAKPTSFRYDRIKQILRPISGSDVLDDVTTPQHRAMVWVADEDHMEVPLQHSHQITQRYALATLFYATGGEDWMLRCHFLEGTDECTWNDIDQNGNLIGVTVCDERGRPTQIDLVKNNVTGTLPQEIGQFTGLSSLQLTSNNITGPIPNLNILANLTILQLAVNAFSGTLPSYLDRLPFLSLLNVATNRITGQIPTAIGVLTNMTVLSLHENDMTGSIPKHIGNLMKLTHLFLSRNDFTGRIPDSLKNLRSLQQLWLSGTKITGNLDVFCGNNFSYFDADCQGSILPKEDPEVECHCCTICCDKSGEGCVPNT